MEDAFIDALMEAQKQGLQTDNGSFKNAGWQIALEAIRGRTAQTIDVKQVKTKWDTLKQDWKTWRAFKEHTGLGWDREKGVPTAEPEILEAYFQSNPRARKFRDKPIPYAEQLQALLDGAMATGEESHTIAAAIHIIQGEAENRLNDDDFDSDVEESYEWPESPSLPTIDAPSISLQSPGDLATTPDSTASNPSLVVTNTGNRSNTTSSLRHRKRSQTNAAEADLRRRKRTGGVVLADAIHDTVDELKQSNKLWADQLAQQESVATRQWQKQEDANSRVANVLVTEFDDLSVEEQAFINSVLENPSKASLFLAWTLERRRDWVNQALSQRYQGLDLG
jgi:Myb/SANT-like DNA-binding domain